MALLATLTCSVRDTGKLRLLSMKAFEGLSRPFDFQLNLVSDKPDIDLVAFLGKSLTVTLELPGKGKRHFNGLVARFVQTGEHHRQAFHYQAILRPWLWFMSNTQDSQIFQNKTVVQIIEDVVAGHHNANNLSKKLSARYATRDYCVQYRESDLAFVSRLMEDAGIYYHFRHTANGHEVVLCDGASAHAPFAGYETIAFSQLADDDLQERLRTWRTGVQVLPNKVTLADRALLQPSRNLRKTHTVSRSHALSGAEIFDHPGGFTEDSDGALAAQLRAEVEQALFKVASGTSDARGLCCGHTFNATSLPNGSENGEYLVTATTIVIEEGLDLGDGQRNPPHFAVEFDAVPSSTPYRAPLLTPKPMVHGPQTAIVVGPSGDHVHTDEHGRVKVQFHWDRLGTSDEKSSCWVRVSQPWAGKGFGMVNIPRVGDEVVVSFLEADPDQPLITGRVHNTGSIPPYALPEHADITGILTRSMGEGDPAKANELRFCDRAGSEYIWLQAQKDFHREVEGNDHDTVKGDQSTSLKGKRQDSVEGTLEQTVGGTVKLNHKADHHLKVGGDLIAESTGVINLQSGGDIAIKAGTAGGVDIGTSLDVRAGADLKAQGGTNIHIKGGMNVTIEAGVTLTLKAGAASIVIGPATIAIDAPMVNINGGGSGSAASTASPPAPARPQEATLPKADSDPMTAA